MPDVGVAGYIVKIWNEVRWCKISRDGVIPVDWCDLDHYSNFNQVTAWEAKCVILMSETYVGSISKYSDESSKPPYCSDPQEAKQQMRDKVSSQLKAMKQSRKAAQ